jgi:hypothetical protein
MTNTTEYPPTHPRHWYCEYCTSGPGEPCRALAGVHAVKDHASRRDAVRLFNRWGTVGPDVPYTPYPRAGR